MNNTCIIMSRVDAASVFCFVLTAAVWVFHILRLCSDMYQPQYRPTKPSVAFVLCATLVTGARLH